MLIIKYSVYSKLLKKNYICEKDVKTIEDFKGFAMALNLKYQILEIIEI
jgi:hypothetical protein